MVEDSVKTVWQHHCCVGELLLVLDSYHGHWTDVQTLLSQSGTDIAIITEGTTAIF